LKTVVN